MANIAVLIISDQTVQNVQFIKEIGTFDKYLFISTQAMEKKGCSQWICNTLHLQENQIQKLNVNEFEPNKIIQELQKHYHENDQYFVNITGGTKLMSLAVNEFFKSKPNATMYYLTGKNEILNLNTEEKNKLTQKITLTEYLTSYGIKINKNYKPAYKEDISQKIYEKFIEAEQTNVDNLKELRDFIQEKNKNAKKVSFSELPCLAELVKNFEFSPEKPNELSKKEAEYLTGKWLEEYTYYKIKKHLHLAEDSIGLGLILQKSDIKNTDNDFDVMFIYENELYIIECKTSHLINGKNNLNEYIYKLDALRKEFGIFPKAFIYTLGNLPTDEKQPQQNQIKDRLKFHNITLITKNEYNIENTITLEDWLAKLNTNSL